MITHWTTRDGRRIPLAEMTDTHLSNTLAMLRRKQDNIEAETNAAAAYVGTSDSMAAYYAEHAMDEGFERSRECCMWIDLLEGEQNRRKAAAGGYRP